MQVVALHEKKLVSVLVYIINGLVGLLRRRKTRLDPRGTVAAAGGPIAISTVTAAGAVAGGITAGFVGGFVGSGGNLSAALQGAVVGASVLVLDKQAAR